MFAFDIFLSKIWQHCYFNNYSIVLNQLLPIVEAILATYTKKKVFEPQFDLLGLI
jgi:hypothetical protein